ncbi:MAG: response regulator transcription factor [Acidobacteriota bacterium]
MSIRVFIADDHAILRDGLKLLLEAREDIAVVGQAGSGWEAIRQIRSLDPDIAIIDIAMPGLNGIEATARLRETSPRTRVVILSMHGSAEHVVRAFSAGAAGYLLKESIGEEVVRAVRSVFAGHRYLTPALSDPVIEDYLSLAGRTRKISPLERLSPREREVLQLVVEGKTNAEIASLTNLSPKTVATYRSRLMRKLDVRNFAELVHFALKHGLTPSP